MFLCACGENKTHKTLFSEDSLIWNAVAHLLIQTGTRPHYSPVGAPLHWLVVILLSPPPIYPHEARPFHPPWFWICFTNQLLIITNTTCLLYCYMWRSGVICKFLSCVLLDFSGITTKDRAPIWSWLYCLSEMSPVLGLDQHS